MGSYLGILESLDDIKSKIFNYVNERLHDRINAWSSNILSKEGKEILIKLVALALPTHIMSCFQFPQTLTLG